MHTLTPFIIRHSHLLLSITYTLTPLIINHSHSFTYSLAHCRSPIIQSARVPVYLGQSHDGQCSKWITWCMGPHSIGWDRPVRCSLSNVPCCVSTVWRLHCSWDIAVHSEISELNLINVYISYVFYYFKLYKIDKVQKTTKLYPRVSMSYFEFERIALIAKCEISLSETRVREIHPL